MESAARTLKQARERAGLTQRLLAQAAGVPQSTVLRIETGKMEPTVEMWERLLAFCGLAVGAEPLPEIGGAAGRTKQPTFLWNTTMTLPQFQLALVSKKDSIRGSAYSRLLSEANWKEIWTLTTPKQIAKNLPLTHFRTKPQWEGLIEQLTPS